MRHQYPKAYLRVDPNIDSHPDPGTIVLLMVWANRQGRRGRFKTLAVVEKVIGKRKVAAAVERGDLVKGDDGYYLAGWDEWQEGDLDVASRMRKLREKKRNSVTEAPVTPASLPSEALRLSGVKASRDNGNRTAPAIASAALTVPAQTWSSEFVDDFRKVYQGEPAKQFFPQVQAVAKRFGWSRTRPVLREYMAETPLEVLAIPKVLGVRVERSIAGLSTQGARASPGKPTVGDRAVAEAQKFLGGGES